MKRIAYFLTMALMLPLFAACSDDTEEILEPEVQKIVKGTDTREANGTYYWLWYKSQKIYFDYLDNKAFIYYHPSNREAIVQKLAERGLKLEDDYDYSLLGDNPEVYTNKGEKLDFLCECVWNEVSASYKDIIDIPEILGACPNLKFREGSACSGTSVITIDTESNETLQKIAEEYKVHIVGTYEYYPSLFVSFVVCDKNSKGNALEIARNIWEKYKVGSEPAFTDIKAC